MRSSGDTWTWVDFRDAATSCSLAARRASASAISRSYSFSRASLSWTILSRSTSLSSSCLSDFSSSATRASSTALPPAGGRVADTIALMDALEDAMASVTENGEAVTGLILRSERFPSDSVLFAGNRMLEGSGIR